MIKNYSNVSYNNNMSENNKIYEGELSPNLKLHTATTPFVSVKYDLAQLAQVNASQQSSILFLPRVRPRSVDFSYSDTVGKSNRKSVIFMITISKVNVKELMIKQLLKFLKKRWNFSNYYCILFFTFIKLKENIIICTYSFL